MSVPSFSFSLSSPDSTSSIPPLKETRRMKMRMIAEEMNTNIETIKTLYQRTSQLWNVYTFLKDEADKEHEAELSKKRPADDFGVVYPPFKTHKVESTPNGMLFKPIPSPGKMPVESSTKGLFKPTVMTATPTSYDPSSFGFKPPCKFPGPGQKLGETSTTTPAQQLKKAIEDFVNEPEKEPSQKPQVVSR